MTTKQTFGRLWCLLLAVLMSASFLKADESGLNIAFNVTRSFEPATYTPGDTVKVTLTMTYTGDETYLGVLDEQVGYIDKYSFKEVLPAGLEYYDAQLSTGTSLKSTTTTEILDEDSHTLTFAYPHHYTSRGKNCVNAMPAQIVYKVIIPETATGNLTWGSDSAFAYTYFASEQEGGFVPQGNDGVTGGSTTLTPAAATEYAVTYHGNGGILSSGEDTFADGTYAAGSSYTLKSNEDIGFSRQGWNWIGWSYAAGGEAIASDTITVDAAKELYALWEEAPVAAYTVTYQGNGGRYNESDSYASAPVKAGETYTIEANKFTYAYHTFAGWQRDGQPFADSTVTMTQDITLVAQWTTDMVNVTYDAGEDATIKGNRTYVVQAEAGSSYTLIADIPVRAGFTFAGWRLAGTTVSSSIQLAGNDVTLTADWEAQAKPKIVYHANKESEYFLSGSVLNVTKEYDAGTVSAPGCLWYQVWTISFQGWSLTNIVGDDIAYRPGDPITLDNDQTLELYAVWKECADITCAGLVKTDPSITTEEEQNEFFDEKAARLNVSNSDSELNATTVVEAGQEAYLWFRLMNYGYRNPGQLSFKVTLDDGQNKTECNDGVLFSYDQNLLETVSKDITNGLLSEGIGKWDFAYVIDAPVMRVSLGVLPAGSYSVKVQLDCNDEWEEANTYAYDENGNVIPMGGKLDNDFTMTFTAAAIQKTTLTLNANNAWNLDAKGSIVYFDPADVECIVGEVVVLPDAASLKVDYIGHKFIGWNTEAAGTGSSYKAGDSYTVPEEATTLYMQWQAMPDLCLYDTPIFFGKNFMNYAGYKTPPVIEGNPVGVIVFPCNNGAADSIATNGVVVLGSQTPVSFGLKAISAFDYHENGLVSTQVATGLAAGEYDYAVTLNDPSAFEELSTENNTVTGKVRVYTREECNAKSITLECAGVTWDSTAWQTDWFVSATNDKIVRYFINVLGEPSEGYTDYTLPPAQYVTCQKGDFQGWKVVSCDGTTYQPGDTITAISPNLDGNLVIKADILLPGYEEWPEDTSLYGPANAKNFREGKELNISFSWPAILEASGYKLVIENFDGSDAQCFETAETSMDVAGLTAGSYRWHVEADGKVSASFSFAVVEDDGVPVITGASPNAKTIEFSFDTQEAGYHDCSQNYQIMMYSLSEAKWYTMDALLEIANGKATVVTPVDAAGSYIYLRPLTDTENNFIELYLP